jgi:glycosyltransferase involved in cell wall biosynthesis
MNYPQLPDDDIREGLKVTPRVIEGTHDFIRKRLEKLRSMDYQLYVHDTVFEASQPVFTIILTMHDAIRAYIEESLECVFSQTYPNTEVILVNNGAQGEVRELIWKYFRANKNSRLIELAQNLFNPLANNLEDPMPNLWNAALFCSAGDFVYFMSYDDLLSLDYVERMVKLFNENPACDTAAPMVLDIDQFGHLNREGNATFKATNVRGRYTNGVELARDYMRGGKQISFPGGLLATRTSLVLQCGGFDKLSDLSQLFKFGIHGDSGFDPQAALYWRRHSGQTNKTQTRMGLVYFGAYKNFADDYNIKTLHQAVAGNEFAEEFEAYLKREAEHAAVLDFRNSYRAGFLAGLHAFITVLKECPAHVKRRVAFHVFRDFPAYVYWNWLPYRAKSIYVALKKFLPPSANL